MFRWRRGKSVPTEAAPAEPASAAATPAPASGPAPSAPPPTIATPAVSVATGELAAIARRLHVGPPRPAHVPAHKAEVPVPVAPPAVPGPAEDAPVGAAERTAPTEPIAAHDAQPDLRPLALIVQEALAHHFGPDGAWALVRRGPESTAGFFDELMTAHIARDVALALGASPATAELPLVDARSMRAAPAPALDGDALVEDAPVEDAETAADVVGRELAVFDRDPLDDDLAELVGPVRREHAGLRAVRSA